MENEIWKDIIGYEGLYQVSNLGRVKSMTKIKPNKLTGGYSIFKERILKPAIGSNGYYIVTLCKENTKTTKTVHRLKALVFIPNPDNKRVINHKDGIKINNSLNYDGSENIEWSTDSENMQHSIDNKLRKLSFKPIVQFDKHGNIANEFEGIIIASKILGINNTSISMCCNDKRKSAGGYKWEFKNNN